jgi:curli biogenesis system outer membrane secretion channel CsgG
VAILVIAGMALCGCATTGRDGGGPISVAVWNPEAIGPMTVAQKAMGEILAARILDQYSQSARYEVVERESLLKVLEEQQIGSSELADDQTRLKLGRIIGCRQMVFGAYQVIGKLVRLDIRSVDVSSGKVLKTAVGTVPAEAINNWLEAADQAARELVSIQK